MFKKAKGPRDPNGTFRAKCVPRKTFRMHRETKNIAAIDFGTKNCSLAYITTDDKLEVTRGIPKLPLNGTYLRVPTAVLFNPSGLVESFGRDARTLFTNLDDSEREEYAYFEEIKMNLHQDQEISRDLKVKAINGKSYYLVDVISHILRFLKDEFLSQHLRRSGHSFKVTDFDWVITVPAIWKARGKQLMREAGYKAGLCSETLASGLAIASDDKTTTTTPLEEETDPDRLSLALEPESAALYCHEMLRLGQVAPYCSNPSGPYAPLSYLLVDIGGGTVDISAHQLLGSDSKGGPVVEELHPPVGNDCGGSKVNQEFVSFLERLVSDLNFSKLTETLDSETNIRNRCELNHLFNVVFEEQKQIFGRLPKERRMEVVIRLPSILLETYREDLLDGIRTVAPSQVKLVRQNLRISAEKMEEFFEPVASGIISCIREVISKLESVDVIYLVGGFGGCPYLYWRILDEFGISYKCIVPPNPEFAVVEGAVMFRSNPSVIHSRRANATYGKSVIRPFENAIHDRSRLFYDDDSMAFCDDLFQVIVEVGDIIRPDEVFTCVSVPSYPDQRNMCVEIFCTQAKAEEVWYVRGDRSGGAVKIGELVVHFAGSVRSNTKAREIEFVFDFSQTEIKVTAYDKVSGREFKTVIDFLSR